MNPTKHLAAGMALLSLTATVVAESDVATNAFLRDNLRNLTSEVAMYRPSLQAMGSDARVRVDAREALARIDQLLAEADRLAAQTRLQEATGKAEAAKRIAIQALVRLKSGETVTHELRFATPADEYAYEVRRFESNKMLVGMQLQEGAPAATRSRVTQELEAARKLRQEAANDAGAGRHDEAVKRMESAGTHLNRALQALGVPVF